MRPNKYDVSSDPWCKDNFFFILIFILFQKLIQWKINSKPDLPCLQFPKPSNAINTTKNNQTIAV